MQLYISKAFLVAQLDGNILSVYRTKIPDQSDLANNALKLRFD